MSEDFFKDLNGITEFEAACRFESYHPLPMGWSIIVTDIHGSTKAIEQGRYKDVNMVGNDGGLV